jgi:cysteine desulfurase
MPVDYLSITGHKIHAPKGIGALFVRRKSPFTPLIYGGHQERGLRGGTESVPHIVAFGRAAEVTRKRLPDFAEKVGNLRDALENGILKAIPNSERNGHTTQRLSNTSNITFRGIESEALLMLLDQEGLCASSGSACLADSDEPSHVIRAMKPDSSASREMVRFSLGLQNTMEEVVQAIKSVQRSVTALRS